MKTISRKKLRLQRALGCTGAALVAGGLILYVIMITGNGPEGLKVLYALCVLAGLLMGWTSGAMARKLWTCPHCGSLLPQNGHGGRFYRTQQAKPPLACGVCGRHIAISEE